MSPRKKKSPTQKEELPKEVQERETVVSGGGLPKRKKPVERPEFLTKQQNRMSGQDLFSELFEDDLRVGELELPSNGLPYKWESGVIQIRPYSTAEQKIITTISSKNYNTIINKLMSSCIVHPSPKDFPVTEYTTGDAIAILFWLRVNSYDPIYKYTGIVCPVCGKKNTREITYDLTKIKFHYLEERPPEPIEVVVNDRVTVYVNLLRRRDELESERIVRRLEKMGVSSEGDDWLQKYITCTEEIEIDGIPYEGNLDDITLMKFYEKMPSKQLAKIDEVHEKYAHGIDTRIDYVCPFCKAESENLIPVGPNFFFLGL